MKGNRIVAVGIIVAAGAWIASGHLFPHETAESRAAVGPAVAETKRFRVSVMVARLEPEQFVEHVLRPIGAEVVVAGADFRFGHGRKGDLELVRTHLDANPASIHWRTSKEFFAALHPKLAAIAL